MAQLAALIGVGVVAFASTNIDDLVMLIGFFADPMYRPGQVTGGQFAGIAGLIALSLLGSLLALVIPASYIGLMGFLPIAIGLRQLLRNSGNGENGRGTHAKRGSQLATVMLVTMSNGGDNLSLYIPLFSIHTSGEVAVFVATFLAMTGLWCLAGHAAVNHRLLGVPAQRWGSIALPYVMIALGSYILAKTEALGFPATN